MLVRGFLFLCCPGAEKPLRSLWHKVGDVGEECQNGFFHVHQCPPLPPPPQKLVLVVPVFEKELLVVQ